ncbi:hypothetical protein EKH55_0164 [Sinorhizobium alkalisoli]|nr:hypothetical protein EKH55_0164 [Sinorhizobium alkalisoli]
MSADGLRRKLLWFFGLWLAGVVIVSLVGVAIKLVLGN